MKLLLMGLLAALVLMATPVFACDQCSGGEPGIVMALDLDYAPVFTQAVQNGIEVTHADLLDPGSAIFGGTKLRVSYSAYATAESATRDVEQSTTAGHAPTAYKADESAGVTAYDTAQGVLRHGGTA